MEGIELRIFLEDRGDDTLEFTLLPECFTDASGLTDLTAKFSAESTVQAAFDLAYEIRTESRSAEFRQ